MKKILILGGNGFIGTNLCRVFLEKNKEVYSFDITEPKIKIKGVKYLTGDFFDDDTLKDIIQDKDIIYHAISTINPGNSNEKYMQAYNNDFIQTIKLCTWLTTMNSKMIFLSSGGTVYGDQKIQPIKEIALPLPINHYGNVKLCIENVIRIFNLQMHTKMLIARISNPYGPNQDYTKGVGFIDAALKKAICRQPIEIWGNGEIIRDYIYIDDVCEILYLLSKYKGNEEVFNVSSNNGISQNEVIKIIRNLLPEIKVRYKESRSVDVKSIILDNSKIANIGIPTLVNINDGIRKYFEYLCKLYKQGIQI